MLHVYAMCGVAFSGKSTLARRIADELSEGFDLQSWLTDEAARR